MRWSHFSKLKHLTVSRKWWSTFSMLKTLRVIRKWWSPFPLLKYLRQWWCPFSVLKTLRGVRKWRSPFYSSKNFNSHNAVVELFWIFKGFNPNLSGLFRGSFWGGGEVKLPHSPCLKLVRIMLETSNLARKYKSIFSFRKYIQKSEIYPKIQKMTMTPEFSGMTSLSNFLTLFSFFCPVSLLIQVSCQYVMELWQFSFIRDWPEIRKSEISLSEFCHISGDWGELWIPNLTRISLTEFYWMLQNYRITAFTVVELLRKNQLGCGKFIPVPRSTQIRIKSRNKVTESFFSGHASLSFHMMHKFSLSVSTEFL